MKRIGRITFLLLSVLFIVTACSNNEASSKKDTNRMKTENVSDENSKLDETSNGPTNGVPQKNVEIVSYWPTEEWRKTSPESVSMDSSLLIDMFQKIEDEDIPMEGFIVVKDGYIVAEKYGGKYSEETPHPIYSVTKSLTSALVGIAINQEEINSVDDKAINYLEEDKLTDLNQWKKELTIESFLTMKSGLDFPEQTQEGFYESDAWKEFMVGENPAYFIFNRSVRENPESWNYSTGDARVVSKIVQEATGDKLSDYAQQKLFNPLGISDVEWPSDRSGTSLGGTGVLMKPRDVAKIGYLYLNDGKWADKQILPKGWVKESTIPHGDTNGNFDGDKYGYFFWLKQVNGYDTFRGMGLYGQYMVVVPELDLVVVQTSSGMDVDPLLEKYIIPSVN
ncbi:serine hydrolase domain-containing protein [Virgibacillus sp. JSM 102003]|uniref:serine hydrolase domain-containing protein n=1 Tax=Virgibacillus sp. JSM 102003 TaxID=1562108 RepID=UPI0035C1CC98